MVQVADQFQSGGTELDVVSATLLAGRSEYAEAAELLRRYVARWPNDARALGMLASLHVRLGNPREAARFYREALARRPDSAMELNNFAWFLATKPEATASERAEALSMARRAVEFDPSSHRFRGTLAVALLAEGHDEEAKAECQRAISMAREAGDSESVDELRARLRQEATDP
jgi:Tfp pilus assembly protein PilF